MAAFLLLLGTQVSAVPQPGQVHVTAAGDFAQTANTGLVLDKLAATGSDVAITLGDMSYGAVGGERGWCDFVKARVGASFPFEMLAGNHESNGLNGNVTDFSACLPNQLPGVVATYGRQHYVDVPAGAPPVRFAMISPGPTHPDGTWSCAVGSARHQWPAQAVDGARAAGVPWVVVSMHKPCLTVGSTAATPAPTCSTCCSAGRSTSCSAGTSTPTSAATSSRWGRAGSVRAGPVRRGVRRRHRPELRRWRRHRRAGGRHGGQLLSDTTPDDPELPYISVSSGRDVDPAHGFLDVHATETVLQAAFVVGAGGPLSDSFTITRGPAPADNRRSPPSPAAGAGPVCGVDASSDSDSDGTITSYAWNFGDGSTGSGVNASRTYAAAGSYPVTLTVTDDDGGTAQATRTLTPTAAAAEALVDDQFSRTTPQAGAPRRPVGRGRSPGAARATPSRTGSRW